MKVKQSCPANGKGSLSISGQSAGVMSSKKCVEGAMTCKGAKDIFIAEKLMERLSASWWSYKPSSRSAGRRPTTRDYKRSGCIRQNQGRCSWLIPLGSVLSSILRNTIDQHEVTCCKNWNQLNSLRQCYYQRRNALNPALWSFKRRVQRCWLSIWWLPVLGDWCHSLIWTQKASIEQNILILLPWGSWGKIQERT